MPELQNGLLGQEAHGVNEMKMVYVGMVIGAALCAYVLGLGLMSGAIK